MGFSTIAAPGHMRFVRGVPQRVHGTSGRVQRLHERPRTSLQSRCLPPVIGRYLGRFAKVDPQAATRVNASGGSKAEARAPGQGHLGGHVRIAA